MSTVSGHPKFLAVWCPPICGHPQNLPLLFKCTKFGQLIPRKIIKIVVTRCQILRSKCTKFDFGWGSASDPAGHLTALPTPIAVFKGPTSKGREGEEEKEEGKGSGGDRKGKGIGRKYWGRRGIPYFYLASARPPTGGFAPGPHWDTLVSRLPAL